VTSVSKITTRLPPDVDRRLRAAAVLRRARLSHVINDALDSALPSLREIGAMVSETMAAGDEPADDAGA